jgi:flavin-dependent dehydrogenase
MYDYLEGERKEDAVVGIDQDESFVKLTCSSGDIVRGKRVIAADGPHSIVRREIFGEEPPLMTQAEQFVIRKKLEGDTIHFYQDERYRGGYRWEFPYGELAKVGFPRNTDDVDDDIIERHRRDIPSGGLHSIVKGRICLVGDAAAQANPLTGGGIRIAMLAGKRAARATVNNNLLDYEDWWRSCPFSSPRFIVAQKQMEKMTNDDFARALRPFKRGFSTIAYINAVVKMPQFRSLYAAYVRSGKVGW